MIRPATPADVEVIAKLIRALADFGITQLPIQEKRLQVVKIFSDEIRLLVPGGHRLASLDRVLPRDLLIDLSALHGVRAQ